MTTMRASVAARGGRRRVPHDRRSHASQQPDEVALVLERRPGLVAGTEGRRRRSWRAQPLDRLVDATGRRRPRFANHEVTPVLEPHLRFMPPAASIDLMLQAARKAWDSATQGAGAAALSRPRCCSYRR